MARELRIAAVRSIPDKHVLEIEWNNGERHMYDLFDHINDFLTLQPLRDLTLFRQVSVDEWGFGLTWGNDLELSLITLRRLTQEPSDKRT
ncbi:DUF2442 domain-containing protein [Pseudomonas orientalis]|uniref:DUF2442 domain-containing protein n=1 Tax=Pseudomonas orientalis TaxID=76758 RepID=UPI000F58D690|nr:DUF2442 domain-containing protein [Pseudomonas orientalis]AZE85263.1 hypothetical protein C4J98_3867 [Pseudomonas orientalis]AZE90723.1 hypothetical protein C4J97_4040 [Pseudomonas orientalis]